MKKVFAALLVFLLALAIPFGALAEGFDYSKVADSDYYTEDKFEKTWSVYEGIITKYGTFTFNVAGDRAGNVTSCYGGIAVDAEGFANIRELKFLIGDVCYTFDHSAVSNLMREVGIIPALCEETLPFWTALAAAEEISIRITDVAGKNYDVDYEFPITDLVRALVQECIDQDVTQFYTLEYAASIENDLKAIPMTIE